MCPQRAKNEVCPPFIDDPHMEITGLCVITTNGTEDTLARVEIDGLHKIGNVETHRSVANFYSGYMYPFIYNSRLHGAIVFGQILRICEVHDGKMIDIVAYDMDNAERWSSKTMMSPLIDIKPMGFMQLDTNGDLVFYYMGVNYIDYVEVVSVNLSGDIRKNAYHCTIPPRIGSIWQPTAYDVAAQIHYIAVYRISSTDDTRWSVRRVQCAENRNVKILHVTMPAHRPIPYILRVRRNIATFAFDQDLCVLNLDSAGYFNSFTHLGVGDNQCRVEFLSDNVIYLVGQYIINRTGNLATLGSYLNLTDNSLNRIFYAEGVESAEILSILSGQ